jgi:hypothetical protein
MNTRGVASVRGLAVWRNAMRTPIVSTGTLLLLALCAQAQEPAAIGSEKVPHRIPKVEARVHVDGYLNEDVWEDALVMGVNTEVRPGENVPAPVRTDMLLAYSESHFYVAFRAFDPDPSAIRARVCDRDAMWDDEWVVIGIDTFNDQRGSLEFACNPLGIQGDNASGIYGDSGAWSTIWDSAGRITGEGYVVEMAIPFSSLPFQRADGEQTWGVDAVRSYPRDVRHHISLYPRDRDNNCYYCQMEKLVGFIGATPGRNIELDPTFSAIKTQEREGYTWWEFEDLDTSEEFGLTARWGVTPSTILSAAFNPDFSQVETDALQLDVNTRFALWYPERRPFFLEGAGVFSDVYTRSIADPHWGVKLTAKEGRNAGGVLVSRDALTNLLIPGPHGSSTTSLDDETTASAVRYRREIGESSYIRFAADNREGEDYYNRVGGLSGRFWLTQAESILFDAMTSRTVYPEEVATEYGQPDEELSDESYSLEFNSSTSGLDWYALYAHRGTDFRRDLAFMPSVGYRSSAIGWGHTWQAGSESWYTMFNVGSGHNYQAEEDGSIMSRGYSFWVNYGGPKESFANLNGWLGREVYLGEEFDTWNLHQDAGFWPTGSLFVKIDGRYGQGIDYDNARSGKQLTITPTICYKMGRHLDLSLNHAYERMNVDAGRLYTANLSYLKAVYQFNRRAFVRAILQYSDETYNSALYTDGHDPEERGLSSQVLFSYKINPQTVLFLGYSDDIYGDQDVDLVRTGRTFFAKIGYAWVI